MPKLVDRMQMRSLSKLFGRILSENILVFADIQTSWCYQRKGQDFSWEASFLGQDSRRSCSADCFCQALRAAASSGNDAPQKGLPWWNTPSCFLSLTSLICDCIYRVGIGQQMWRTLQVANRGGLAAMLLYFVIRPFLRVGLFHLSSVFACHN